MLLTYGWVHPALSEGAPKIETALLIQAEVTALSRVGIHTFSDQRCHLFLCFIFYHCLCLCKSMCVDATSKCFPFLDSTSWLTDYPYDSDSYIMHYHTLAWSSESNTGTCEWNVSLWLCNNVAVQHTVGSWFKPSVCVDADNGFYNHLLPWL